jgi:histidine triad (HIT) family protein
MPDERCIFCDIVKGTLEAEQVFEDEHTLAFLDHRPLFYGHTLLVPKIHFGTLENLPRELLEPFFGGAQLLAAAIEDAMDAVGTFIALNNKVSQSVPHLHAHIVPRRPKDGLRGFFWPRTKYRDAEDMQTVGRTIRDALARR